MRVLLGLAVLALGLASAAVAQRGEKVFENDNWQVVRTKDSMTDKILCTGFHRKSRAIQLNADRIWLDYRGQGGVEFYRTRFDDLEAGEVKAADDAAKRLGAVAIPEVEQALKSKRLRISGSTMFSRRIEEDVDLTGTADAHKVISGKLCE